MIKHNVYSPLFKKEILIEIKNTKMLKKCIKIAKELQQKYLNNPEEYRKFQELIDSYEETLDLSNGGKYDI